MTQDPGVVFEAIYESGTPGLVGALEIAIHDNQAAVVFGPTSAGIVELVVDGEPTGTYRADLTAPATLGQYAIIWSNDGSFDPQAGGGVEDLLVEVTSLDLPSLGGAAAGILCSAWTTADEVVFCCEGDGVGSDSALLDASIVASSEFLHLASGKQYPGLCSRSVQACEDESCGCCVQFLTSGYVVWPHGIDWSLCTCTQNTTIKLAGAVQSITTVTIDGDAFTEYELHENRLKRVDGAAWPCSTEVTYVYGKAPPVLGQLAARTLACELTKACTPGVECAIPNGIVSVTRQGISFERAPFARNDEGRWETGMTDVDLFLNSVNPNGLVRTAVSWSPVRGARYARPVPS